MRTVGPDCWFEVLANLLENYKSPSWTISSSSTHCLKSRIENNIWYARWWQIKEGLSSHMIWSSCFTCALVSHRKKIIILFPSKLFQTFFSFLTNIHILCAGSGSQHINTGSVSNTELSNTAEHSGSVVGCIHDRLRDSAWKEKQYFTACHSGGI